MRGLTSDRERADDLVQETGQRLTLYVTREVAGQNMAFRFGQDGPVSVFYWVDDRFGYALSAGADREELMKVSQEV